MIARQARRLGAASPEWMQRAERGNLFWLAVMRWISLRLGRTVSRLLLPFIALYFLLAAREARQASRGFLQRCLPGGAGWRDVWRNIHAFAAVIHDRIYLFNGRASLFDVRLHGIEELHASIAARGGVLVFGSHLGSFEALRAASRLRPEVQLYMAMYSENARRVNRILAAIHPGLTPRIIELGRMDSLVEVHQRLDEGAIVGVLADRSTRTERLAVRNFLGAPACFPAGPFRLAALLRRPVYFVAGIYAGGRRYELHFERLTDFAAEPTDRGQDAEHLLDRYVSTLERHCRAAPYNWFNFFDFWAGAAASGAPPGAASDENHAP